MSVNILFRISFYLLFCLFYINSYVAASEKTNPILRLKNYSYKEGLSQASVHSIIQDDDGYLWVSTQEGLNRFNGKDFIQFLPEKNNPTAIKDLLITSMVKDDLGRIWLSGNSGISYVAKNSNQFINFKISHNDKESLYIKRIIKADNGYLWLQSNKKLWSFNTVTFEVKEIKNYPSGVLLLILGEEGAIYLATTNGIYKKSSNQSEFRLIAEYPNVDIDILDININNGVLWVINTNNIIKLNLENFTWEPEQFPLSIKPVEMQQIIFYNDDIWLASGNGLWFKDSNCHCWYRYAADPLVEGALSTSQIQTIFMDKQKQLWIGTNGGGLSVRNPNHQSIIHWLTKRQLSDYSQSLSLLSLDILDVNSDGIGGLFVSTTEQGVFQLAGNGEIIKQYSMKNSPLLQTNDVNQVIFDLHQRLWMATFPAGLQMITADGEWHTFKTDKNNSKSLEDDYVFELYEDRSGNIWIGTLAGAQIYQPETKSFLSVSNQYPSGGSVRTNVIKQSLNGLYWLGTEGGVVVLDQELKLHSWFHYSSELNPILSDEVNDIAEDAAGNIWIATGKGLNKISKINGKYSVSSFEDFPLLTTKTLVLIEVDENGLIWIAGNLGLLKFNPSTEELIVVPSDYGLQSQQFNVGSSYQDEQGFLYFGGTNGINKLASDFSPTSEINVPIHLAEVKADGVAVSKTKGSTYIIPAQTKFTRFYFDILDLSSSAIYELRIRIPEYSDDWLPWSEQRYFDFFDMPTGNITLEIQSRSKSDSKVIDKKVFNLYVESFYSWYDYLFWLILLLSVLFSFLFMRKNNLQWKTEKHLLAKTQLKLSESINEYKSRLSDKELEVEQLLDEIAVSINQNQLLESQLSDIHLVDKQTGLHTKDFIKLSIDNATQQLEELYNNNENSIDSLPQLLFLIIKLDNFEALRLEGGQFLLNQIIIQIAAEIKKINANTDELVRWNKDSFLLYSRSEDQQKIIRKCNKITDIINQGMFGPSEDEKLKISCSIGVVKYPFSVGNYSQLNWILLLDIANAAASQLNDNGGNGWVIVSENAPSLKEEQIELIVSDFDSAVDKQLISVTSSKS